MRIAIMSLRYTHIRGRIPVWQTSLTKNGGVKVNEIRRAVSRLTEAGSSRCWKVLQTGGLKLSFSLSSPAISLVSTSTGPCPINKANLPFSIIPAVCAKQLIGGLFPPHVFGNCAAHHLVHFFIA